MRIRITVAIAVLGLAVSACGSGGTAPGSATTPPAATNSPTAAWTRITDPSGAAFSFPAHITPTLSSTDGLTTRTYLANVGANVVASVVIIPTPVALNVKNFVVQYPTKLKAKGYINITSDRVTTFTHGGLTGYQTGVRYDTPGSGQVYEQRDAIQSKKYLIVISGMAANSAPLTSADIALAKAVNTRLVAGFLPGSK